MAYQGKEQRELTGKFKVVRFLGKGSYGSVFQVQRLNDSQTYALKEMDVRSMGQAEREDSANEVRLLASVRHPNVIAYHEAFLDGNRLCIIMEYAPDGDLSKYIKKWQSMRKSMPEDLIWKLIIQIARGLAALHGMKILHRDIKPGNIMVLQGDIAKIGDLGIAKLLTNTMAAKTQIGTPHYMPPEIWKNRPYSFSSDCWALGCLAYEMATYNVPFEARSMNELRYKVLRGSYPPISNQYSRDLINLVKDCLDMIPERRPTMEAILNSPPVTSRIHLLQDGARPAPPSTAGSALINTIKVPKGNFQAIKGKLPPANYASDYKDILGPGNNNGFAGIPEGGPQRPAEVLNLQNPSAPAAARLPILAPQQRPPPVNPSIAPRAVGAGAQVRFSSNTPVAHPQPAPVPPRNIRPYGIEPPAAIPANVSPYANDARAPVYAAPSPSVAQASKWSGVPRPAGVGVKHPAVSESHAAYGAFYAKASPVKPAAALKPVDEGLKSPVAYGAGAANRPYKAPAYAPDYVNPYLGNRAPAAVGASPKLPPLAQPAQAAAGPRPNWNYGVGGGARAAALAYAAQVKQAQVANAAPRYQPPPWQQNRHGLIMKQHPDS